MDTGFMGNAYIAMVSLNGKDQSLDTITGTVTGN